jgi:Putative glycosyl/glycerophosphate transferases involved in teichoic acid biosynthesis TagF/TagB/EpsJ/RodC
MGLFAEYRQVNQLLKQKRPLVFYAESRHYYAYFEDLVSELLQSSHPSICYITSDANDPLLSKAPPGLEVIYVKWMLGFLFSRLRAGKVIMTMPDLDNFLFKRSPEVDEYIYVFHAAVSTHQQYRQKAFFHYDTIFCTGDHQVKEIRAAEKKYDQQEKRLIPYGYPLLGAIGEKVKRSPPEQPTILVAPSWYEGCIFDTCLEPLLLELSKLPYRIVLRSHPEYQKRKKKEFNRVSGMIRSNPQLSIDKNVNVIDSLAASHFLVTDRSGIAFEFAFGAERPVLFIDTVPKVVNSHWKELNIEPIENSWRGKLGLSLLPGELEHTGERINQLEEMAKGFKEKTMEWGRELFYAYPASDKKGIEHILLTQG